MALTGLEFFERATLPRWARVRQRLDATDVGDIAAVVAEQFARPGIGEAIHKGDRVALTAGSRGIDRIDVITRAVVEQVRRRGGMPFIVPAMGSHGGATVAGQLGILDHLGITEAAMGCEIRASMATVHLGDLDGAVPVHTDRTAYEQADLVVPIGRVKPHTDFTGPVESGIMKMLAIGLGKQRGADYFHSRGFRFFHDLIPAVAQFVLTKVEVPFGVAIVENGYSKCALVECIPSNQLVTREPELLAVAREKLGTLPPPPIDVLVVDRIGKDISGTGADTNVINREIIDLVDRRRRFDPTVQRVVFGDLTDDTEGNATGVGMADLVVQRLVDKMDRAPSYMNMLTSKCPEGVRVPMTADTDRQALHLAIACCLEVEAASARIARIADTKNVAEIRVSEALLPDYLATGRIEQLDDLAPIAFDAAGDYADR